MTSKPPFAAALEFLIRNTKTSQGKIALSIGVTQSYISGMVKGHRNGSEQTRRDIASFFNIEYDEFLKMGQRIVENEGSLSINGEMATVRRYTMIDRLFDRINQINETDPDKIRLIEGFIEGVALSMLEKKKS